MLPRIFLFACLTVLGVYSSISQQLFDAVRIRDTVAIAASIASGADINSMENDSTTALIMAVRNGDMQTAGWLLRHGAKVDHRVTLRGPDDWESEMTALMIAVIGRDSLMVDLLLAYHPDIDDQATYVSKKHGSGLKSDGYTPLMFAVAQGYENIVRSLLTHKADPNIQAQFSMTEYILDTSPGGSLNLNLIKKKKHDFDNKDALHIAVARVDTGIVKALIEGGADVDSKDALGQSSLSFAVASRSIRNVELLLSKRTDPNAENGTEHSPLIIATKLGDRGIANKLLSAGADPNQKAGNIEAPVLAWAVTGGNIEIASDLLAHGADPNETTNNKSTPLMMASGAGNVELIGLLLKAKAKIDARNEKGQTALIVASRKGQLKAVETLVTAGADVSIEDKSNLTALGYAKQSGNAAIIGILEKSGR